jgi:hypothetical protein
MVSGRPQAVFFYDGSLKLMVMYVWKSVGWPFRL